MGIINEIIITYALLIVILILFLLIKSNIGIIKRKIDEEKNKELELNIKKLKNAFIIALAILSFSVLIDIYNELTFAENTYIHVLGIFKYAKISKGYINTMFVFSISELIIIIELLLLVIFSSTKKRLIVLLACMIVYGGVLGIKLNECYTFFKEAQKYTYINEYNIESDFKKNKEISETGALKAIKNEFEFDYINNVITEKANIDEVKDETIKYSCDYENFWIVSFDYMKNYEITKGVCVLVDLKTGQISYITYPEGTINK